MKKCYLLLLLFVCLISNGQNVLKGGVYYSTYGDSAIVTEEYGYTYSGDIVIPQTVTISGKQYTVSKIGSYAFGNSTELSSVKMPSTITRIENAAFVDCKKLKKIVLSDSLKYLGENAFYNCYELDSIVLPSKIKRIEYTTFNNCYALNHIVLPDGLLEITYNAFDNCRSLKSINIPKNTNFQLGYDVFLLGYCPALEHITVDSLNPYYFSKDDIVYTKDTSAVVLSSSFISGNYIAPSSVKAIWNRAFYGCSKLDSVILTNVDSVANYAFSGCSKISYLHLSEKLRYVGHKSFEGCKSIKTITCLSTLPPSSNYGSSVFGSDELSKAMIYAQAKLRVPSAGFKLYRLMEPWKNFDTEAIDFDMIVVPAANNASFTWTPTTGAQVYKLTICSDPAKTDTVCVLTFNAYGQLTALALRSASDSVNYVGGFSFTVTSLGANTNYYYGMDAYTDSNQLVASKEGSFRTASSTTGIANTNTDAINIKTVGNTIEINCMGSLPQSDLNIYRVDGVKLCSKKLVDKTTSIPVDSDGVYLVQVGELVKKLMVKK